MEIPRQIGPYRPLDHLGSGGMGEVYLARAPDGALLAVKTIRADLITRPDLRVRLRREAEAMSRVRGEHLAELVAYDLDAEPPYLATRYVQGRSLRDLVAEEGPLPLAALWRLADGLARALVGVHGAGYLHRDLKPANVMVVDGSPVVIDFGISHALDETRLSRHGRASGTPAYMAPELIAEGRAEPAGDVYSWAATVAYAATGRDAHWSALGPVGLARALFAADGLSPDLREILDAAFASDPRDRPTAGELVERLAPLAPVTGADLYLDHPYEAGATTVTLTLPGGRQVTLDLPPDAEAGKTLRFPGQGHLGRNGGSPGALHVYLLYPSNLPDVVAQSIPVRSRARRSRRIYLLIPALLLLGAVTFTVRVETTPDKTKDGKVGVSPSSVRIPVPYSVIPKSCRLLSQSSVQTLLPGAEIPGGEALPESLWKTKEQDSCDISSRERWMGVHLKIFRVGTHAAMFERARSSFRSDLEEEKMDPYSRIISQDLGLGDASFAYVRTGRPGYVRTNMEVLEGNIILKIEFQQPPEEYQEKAKRAASRDGLEKLAGEVVQALSE